MTPERWQQVSRVCQETLARRPEERADFLASACRDDVSLRREVESLVARESEAVGFLSTPAVALENNAMAEARTLIGRQLGPYTILGRLGEGGMGEVYRARDAKLGREVAIKILPRLFTIEPERRARFDREARLLAALNHPHIGAIYGVEDMDGTPALILELVDGDTLAERIAVGPMPIGEALNIAHQIADALEAAHEKGITHRDLKPANIKITTDGVVKVLDFGLAKAASGDGSGPDLTQSPTVAGEGTREGVILGTAAYMSPEQARGKPVDKRTDIWAFGCVLYEMLTGRVPFAGETLSDTLAAILERGPNWQALPSTTPDRVRDILRRCLEKDPHRRLRDIGDARLDVDDAIAAAQSLAPGVNTQVGSRRKTWTYGWVAAAVIVLLAAIGLPTFMYVRRAPVETRAYRASILPPASLSGLAAARLALSPDGRRLAFVAPDATGRVLLWVRPLDGLSAQPLSGTEGASGPFWSPDSRSLAFVAGNKLKRIDASGGPAWTLCDTIRNVPGSWNRDDVILFTPRNGAPLFRVSAAGGTPSPVTALDTKAGEATHAFPFFLPDGRHFLYLAQTSSGVPQGVFAASLDSTERTRLLEGGSNAQYAQGSLIFLSATTLMARPFDVTRLKFTGEAVPLAEQVQVSFGAGANSGTRTGAFAVSDSGVLVYQAGSTAAQLVWFDRAGRQIGVLGDRADYADLFLSPDGKQVSISVAESGAISRDIWTFDVARDLRTRFTFDSEDEFEAPWSPDGNRRAFNLRRKGHLDLYQKTASGAGNEQVLLETSQDKYAQSWSPDGQFLLFLVIDAKTDQDLWVLPLSGGGKPFPFRRTPFMEGTGQFSPDGHWIAYRSNESGRTEVYVAPFPGPGEKWQISTAGGNFPRWRRDGKEIFYLAPENKLMAATVTMDGARVDVGAVRSLFDVRPGARWFYDVSPDGQRFLVNTVVAEQAAAPITLVVNWPAGLKK